MCVGGLGQSGNVRNIMLGIAGIVIAAGYGSGAMGD